MRKERKQVEAIIFLMGFLTSSPFVWGGGTRVTGVKGKTRMNEKM